MPADTQRVADFRHVDTAIAGAAMRMRPMALDALPLVVPHLGGSVDDGIWKLCPSCFRDARSECLWRAWLSVGRRRYRHDDEQCGQHFDRHSPPFYEWNCGWHLSQPGSDWIVHATRFGPFMNRTALFGKAFRSVSPGRQAPGAAGLSRRGHATDARRRLIWTNWVLSSPPLIHGSATTPRFGKRR